MNNNPVYQNMQWNINLPLIVRYLSPSLPKNSHKLPVLMCSQANIFEYMTMHGSAISVDIGILFFDVICLIFLLELAE